MSEALQDMNTMTKLCHLPHNLSKTCSAIILHCLIGRPWLFIMGLFVAMNCVHWRPANNASREELNLHQGLVKLIITLKNTKYRERTRQRGADGDVIPVPQSLQLPKRALLKARNAPWLWVLLFQETVPGRSLLWVLWGAPVPLQEEAGR